MGNTFVLYIRVQYLQDTFLQYPPHKLLLHKMCSIINGIGIAKVFAPCTEAHNSAFSVMVTCTEEGMERVLAAGAERIIQGSLSMTGIFPQGRKSEMETLPVTGTWSVYTVKQTRHTRNQRKPGEQFKI